MLYVAQGLPDRRRPESEPALHDELEALINAAGGRTLALFTSWRAMNAAVDALSDRLPFPLLSQSDLPKPALIEAFSDERGDLPLRHPRLLAGGRHPGADPQPGDPRPHPVPPARRTGAAGPPGPGRRRGLHRRRPAPGGHTAGPGRRTAHPHGPRPWGGGGAGQPPGHRPVPGRPAGPGAAHEAHGGPRRGGGLPAPDHRRRAEPRGRPPAVRNRAGRARPHVAATASPPGRRARGRRRAASGPAPPSPPL